MRFKLLAVIAIAGALLSGCGYNEIQVKDERVNAAWSEVLNMYQRRADLIPNLVNVVQGYASHEREVLTDVTQARAQVAGIKATPELINDPQAFARFQQAQAELSGALSRLLLVVENYPNLKADANFRDLQAQVEGTENRIAVARNRYITSVQDYNTTVRVFPNNLTAMVFGYDTKPNFSVQDESIARPPTIQFDTGPRPAPGAARSPAQAPTAQPGAAPQPGPAPTPQPGTAPTPPQQAPAGSVSSGGY